MGSGGAKPKHPQKNTQYHQPVFGPTSHYSPSRRRGGHIHTIIPRFQQDNRGHTTNKECTHFITMRAVLCFSQTPGRRRPPWFDHFDQNTIPRIMTPHINSRGPPTTRRMGLPAAFGHIQEFERRGRPLPTTRPSARGAHQRERASHLHKHLSTLNSPHAIELLFVYVT